jgi:hypothetical protein
LTTSRATSLSHITHTLEWLQRLSVLIDQNQDLKRILQS